MTHISDSGIRMAHIMSLCVQGHMSNSVYLPENGLNLDGENRMKLGDTIATSSD